MKKKSYQTLSKFGRIYLSRDTSSFESRNVNVNKILSEIKHMNDFPLNKRSKSSISEIPQRLLLAPSSSLNVKKARSRCIPAQKPTKKAPIVRKCAKRNSSEIPSSTQYSPNYEICFPAIPQYKFPRANVKRIIDINQSTQSEIIKEWEKGPRGVKFPSKPKPKAAPKPISNSEDDWPSEYSSESETETPTPREEPPAAFPTVETATTQQPHYQTAVTAKKPPQAKSPQNVKAKAKKKPVGIISGSCGRGSFIPKSEAPPPGQYYFHNVGDSRASSFAAQSDRREQELLPDRVHFDLGKSIDSTKQQAPRCIPFNRQVARSKDMKQKDLWSEIEKEQEQLHAILHPPVVNEVKKIEKVQPFSQQTSYFDSNPFQQFMGPEISKDLQYDVENAHKLADRRILPINGFGRRKNDTDRAIYSTSEAPDVFYGNVNEQWMNTKRKTSGCPIFSSMNERKSAYEYMPKIAGGNYTEIKIDNWSYRTPVVMDKMSERELMIDMPPHYL